MADPMNPLAPVTRTGPACESAGWTICDRYAREAGSARWIRAHTTKATMLHQLQRGAGRSPPAGLGLARRLRSHLVPRNSRNAPRAAMLKFFAAIGAASAGTRHVRPSSADGKLPSRAPKSRVKTPDACPERWAFGEAHRRGGKDGLIDSEPSDPGRSPCPPMGQRPLALRRLENGLPGRQPYDRGVADQPQRFRAEARLASSLPQPA